MVRGGVEKTKDRYRPLTSTRNEGFYLPKGVFSVLSKSET